MRLLITGAGGLIGGYLADLFSSQGHEVVATYRATVPKSLATAPKIKFLKLDIVEGLERIGPVDGIIHAAAHTHLIPNSTAADYIHSNVTGTLNLARYAKSVDPRVVVYLSTLSVYGSIETSELQEDTPLNRPEMYGLTKYMGEMILREHADSFPTVCIRMPGVVGRGYFTPWLGSVLKRAARNEPITVYNPDSLFNNVVDLMEVQAFIAQVTETEQTGFKVVNLSSVEPINVRQVVELVVSTMGSSSPILEEQSTRQSFSISTEYLMREFDFQPSTTRDIVERYVSENRASLFASGVGGKD